MLTIRTPLSPHGTITSKRARSQFTFSAKPCSVSQRRRPTPIDAILRRSSSQTPA